MQVYQSELNNPKKVFGCIASFGSHAYESGSRISENQCQKLNDANIRYAQTYDGTLISILVDEENYELAKETLKK
jgi:hypothetical protein